MSRWYDAALLRCCDWWKYSRSFRRSSAGKLYCAIIMFRSSSVRRNAITSLNCRLITPHSVATTLAHTREPSRVSTTPAIRSAELSMLDSMSPPPRPVVTRVAQYSDAT